MQDPSDGPLGMFDRIPPDTLAKLTRAHQALSGELLEVVFDDVRLITRPVFVSTWADVYDYSNLGASFLRD